MSPFNVSILLVFVFCVGAVFVNAGGLGPGEPDVSDLDEDSDEVLVSNNYQVEERADRHRRVTCDLLSYGGKVNHSACAAHCLARGKAGGRCNNGICQCRKTKFTDLFGK